MSVTDVFLFKKTFIIYSKVQVLYYLPNLQLTKPQNQFTRDLVCVVPFVGLD